MNISTRFLVFTTSILIFAGCETDLDKAFPTGRAGKLPAYKGRIEYKAVGDRQVNVIRLESGGVYLLRPDLPIWDNLAGQSYSFHGMIVPLEHATIKAGQKTSSEDLWKTKAFVVRGKPEIIGKTQTDYPEEVAPPVEKPPGSSGIIER